MPSKKSLKIKSLLICDDIREEKSGKEILIGVYRTDIVFRHLPTALPKLCFRIELEVAGSITGSVSFWIKSPSGEHLGRVEQELADPISPSEVSHVFAFHLNNLKLESAGRYEVVLGVGSKPKSIGYFRAQIGDEKDLLAAS